MPTDRIAVHLVGHMAFRSNPSTQLRGRCGGGIDVSNILKIKHLVFKNKKHRSKRHK
jgi:hypothetical protein